MKIHQKNAIRVDPRIAEFQLFGFSEQLRPMASRV